MKERDGAIPFRKTLTFKLFASYCLVVLVTVLTTLTVHILGVQRHIYSKFERDSLQLAQELRPQAEEYLSKNLTHQLDSFLTFAQASTGLGVNFVSFEPDLVDSYPAFSLTADERRQLTEGQGVKGEAEGRVDPKTLGAKHPRKGRRHLQRSSGDCEFRKGSLKGPRHSPKRGRFHEPDHFVAIPLSLDDKVAGALVIYDTKPGFSRRARVLGQTATNGLVIALFPALLCALILARNLTRPIRRMEDVAHDYTSGNFDTRTNLKREDELGVLAKTFDNMASELEQNIATRERLLSDVSHELGTPVTTIRATLEAILDEIVEPDQRNFYLQSSLNELEHLSRIVKDITELSRFETGEIKIVQDIFLAENPIQQSVEAALILARRKGIEVEVGGCDREIRARGDLLRITQVVKNLVMNAVQHNPKGTKVRAFWAEENDRVLFTIEDDGPQIEEADAARIFERFYKVSESRTRDESSSGLGLAIVKRILQGHDSKIVFSNTAEGKSFVFSLPREQS